MILDSHVTSAGFREAVRHANLGFHGFATSPESLLLVLFLLDLGLDCVVGNFSMFCFPSLFYPFAAESRRSCDLEG